MGRKPKSAAPAPAPERSEKDRLLDDVFKQIRKEFGEGAIIRLGDRPALNQAVFPTGSLLLDQAIGIGGYPKGRVIEIYGPESSGKTTLALHAAAEMQKKGGRVAYIDAENAIDPVYAQNLGVNIDELILTQPDSGEQGLNIMQMLIASGAVDLVIVDSVAALTPQAEIEGAMDSLQVGAQARMMGKAMRKLSGLMNHNECTAIFINQIRHKVGVMYGNPETTPGGNALKFYASLRIEIRKSEILKNGADPIGNKAKIKIVKNKVAPPFKTAEVEIIYGKGISALSELIDLAVEYNIIKKSGAWYSCDGEKIGQGKEQTKSYFNAHPEFYARIKEEVSQCILNASDTPEPSESSDASDSSNLPSSTAHFASIHSADSRIQEHPDSNPEPEPDPDSDSDPDHFSGDPFMNPPVDLFYNPSAGDFTME